MKVLHIIDSGGLYGAEIMLLNLMQEQKLLGCEPVLASIGEKYQEAKPIEVQAEKKGFVLKTFRMSPGPNMAGAIKIVRYALLDGVDILHTHGYKANIFMGLLPRCIRRLPVVSTLHGWTSTGKLDRMILYEWLDRLSLRLIDRVVAVNSTMRDKIGIRDLRVVNNGIPVNDMVTAPEPNVSSEIDDDVNRFCMQGFTFGAIGRLSPEKGFGTLIDAVKIASVDHPEVQLVIIGDGSLMDDLIRRSRELGISGRIMFAGYRDNASKYLSCFKVFVLSSLTEGLPMVVLEAMRAGVPIVATRVGGVPEVLDNGSAGILLDSGNASDIAKGMIHLLEHPGLRVRLAGKAQSRVSDRYSSRLMAEKYCGLYQELLQKRNY